MKTYEQATQNHPELFDAFMLCESEDEAALLKSISASAHLIRQLNQPHVEGSEDPLETDLSKFGNDHEKLSALLKKELVTLTELSAAVTL